MRTMHSLWREYLGSGSSLEVDPVRLRKVMRDTLRADIAAFKAGHASRGRVRQTRADLIRFGKLMAAEPIPVLWAQDRGCE